MIIKIKKITLIDDDMEDDWFQWIIKLCIHLKQFYLYVISLKDLGSDGWSSQVVVYSDRSSWQ